MKSIFLFLSLLMLSQNVLAYTSDDKLWKKLLHFNYDLQRSEIENDDFFISKLGQINPQVEKEATLKAFLEGAIDKETDQPFLCKYPARALFFIKLGYDLPDPYSSCPAFAKWLGEKQNIQLSIVYADGYMGNPASFYGHILFKINNNKQASPLSNTLNFGARVPDNENPVVYILKGLSGGYDARYTSNNFYRYNINYTEVEMRDLWEYRLNLTQEEAYFLAAHAWEMLFTDYTYYFTHRNCAYFIARMMDLVLTESLVSTYDPFVLPVSVFTSLMEAKTVSGNLAVANVERKPSRQSRFRQMFSELNVSEKQVFNSILNQDISLSRIKSLNEQAQIHVLDTMIDYLDYLLITGEENPTLLKKKKDVRKARIRLPLRKVKFEPKAMTKPHIGHHPSLFRLSYVLQDSNRDRFRVALRPAFYDKLSRGGGILENSALSMAELELDFSRNDIAISKFNFLNIEALPIDASGLKGDRGIAWNLRFGNERDFLTDFKPTNEWFLEGGIGKAQKKSRFIWFYFLNARIQTPNVVAQRYILEPKFGFIFEHTKHKFLCEFSYPVSIKSSYTSKLTSECEASLFQTQKHGFRIGLGRSYDTELSLSYLRYF